MDIPELPLGEPGWLMTSWMTDAFSISLIPMMAGPSGVVFVAKLLMAYARLCTFSRYLAPVPLPLSARVNSRSRPSALLGMVSKRFSKL